MKYDKIYQISRSSLLKRPTKVAINSSFFRALCQILLTFYQLQFGKKIMLKQIVCSIDKIYHKVFPEVVVLKHSMKVAMSSSFFFRRAAYLCVLSEKRQRKFHWLLTANLLVIILWSKTLFNGSQFLSWSILYKTLQRLIWNPVIHPR